MDEKQKEEEILKALKEWRRKTAGEINLPESVIMQDDALEKISRKKPKTKSELKAMSVISEGDFMKYGDSMVKVVTEKAGGLHETEIEEYGEALMDLIKDEKIEVPEKKTKEHAAAAGPAKESFLEVSKLSGHIKNLLNDPNLSQIYVRGEVKNLARSPPPAKHIYFDIKEKNSLLNCVFLENKNKGVDFKLDNGSEVFVFGSVQTSEEKSAYQLNVDSILPAWKGELIFKFEKLKEKLAGEGLFDEKNKKEIPYLYKTLGLITPKESKAHAEVIEVLKHRFPVNIKRVFVDTDKEIASKDIINAIKALNQVEEIGVILIASDDGSIEHIKCFNDEALARAIYESKIPIITGIGSEKDYTIADFVSDKSAPTPEIAAKMAVPDRDEVIDRITQKKEIPETSSETTTTYVQKEIPPIEIPREAERRRETQKRELQRREDSTDKTKTYKLIALGAVLIICVIILIFLVMMLL